MFLQVDDIVKRLKISNDELFILLFIVNKRDYFKELLTQNSDLSPENEFDLYKKELYLSSLDAGKFKIVMTEMLHYLLRDVQLIHRWLDYVPEKAPINGVIIRNKWDVPAKLMKRVIYELRKQWIDSNYEMNAEQLMSLENKENILEIIRINDYEDYDCNIRMKCKKLRRL